MRIMMTKTKCSNAVVAEIDTDWFEGGRSFWVVDSSNRNWLTNSRCCHNVKEAFNFLESRGFKNVAVDREDGSREYVSVYDFQRENGLR